MISHICIYVDEIVLCPFQWFIYSVRCSFFAVSNGFFVVSSLCSIFIQFDFGFWSNDINSASRFALHHKNYMTTIECYVMNYSYE